MAEISKIKVNGVIYDVKDAGALRVGGDANVNNFSVSAATPTIKFQSTNLDITATPSSSYYSGGIYFADKNNNAFGRYRAEYFTDKSVAIDMFAYREVSGATVYNGVRFSIDPQGNKTTYFQDPASVRSALGITDSGWVAVTNNTSVLQSDAGHIYYRKIYNFVEVHGYGMKLAAAMTGTAASSVILTNLPTGYRPPRNILCAAGTPSVTDANGYVVIGNGGNVTFHKPKGVDGWATTTLISFQALFMI